MSQTHPVPREFINKCEDWLCDGYEVDVRYIARPDGNALVILSATVSFVPLPSANPSPLKIRIPGLVAGQSHIFPINRLDALKMIDKAVEGTIELADATLVLQRMPQNGFATEMGDRDRWAFTLHIEISGTTIYTASNLELQALDNALRNHEPPFDGYPDLRSWLGLMENKENSSSTAITVRVLPPADLVIEQSSLLNGTLHLVLHAICAFDTRRVGLSVRSLPGLKSLADRTQVCDRINWTIGEKGLQIGQLTLDVPDSDQALVVLMIGSSVVRRNWFLDPLRSRNLRLIATQHFDRELKMIRNAVLDSTDGKRFESGVASLLFLLGFSASVQLETDSPDLIVTTPSGRLLVCECTTRLADFQTKLGKLIDRRSSLSKTLTATGHSPMVAAVLVCALPRDQILATPETLDDCDAHLVTREELEKAFSFLRYGTDPDQLLSNADRGRSERRRRRGVKGAAQVPE